MDPRNEEAHVDPAGSLLLLANTAALAETPDLTGYTMDELVTLRQQVDAAMLNLTRSVDRSDAFLDGIIWVSNGSEVRINAYEGTAASFTSMSIFESGLRVVVIPASVTNIVPGVFEKCNRVTIVTHAGSYAEQYCKDNWLVCNTKDYDKYVAEYEALLAE